MRKKFIYFENRNDEYFMPDTQRQGWGQITGQKTEVVVSDENRVRTRTRNRIDA